MKISKIGHSLVAICLGYGIMGFVSQSYGYLEYRYYCDIQGSKSITITLKSNGTNTKCLQHMKSLDQSITYYAQQIKQARANITSQPDFTSYWQSYIDQTSPRLIQARIMHMHIKRAMTKFETDLFTKTMIYIRHSYEPARTSLIDNLQRRQKALDQSVDAGDEEAVIRITKKHRTDKRRLEMINLMLQATNFEELMPFYSVFDDIPNREQNDDIEL